MPHHTKFQRQLAQSLKLPKNPPSGGFFRFRVLQDAVSPLISRATVPLCGAACRLANLQTTPGDGLSPIQSNSMAATRASTTRWITAHENVRITLGVAGLVSPAGRRNLITPDERYCGVRKM